MCCICAHVLELLKFTGWLHAQGTRIWPFSAKALGAKRRAGDFFWGGTPLATALPTGTKIHVAIFDFDYGSLKPPLKGFLALRGMLV
jgi:hypothetical protein